MSSELFHPFSLADIPAEGGSISPRPERPDYKIDPDTGCWNWQRGLDHKGYGRVTASAEVLERKAHREYYRRAYGVTLTPATHVHHRCENVACVNPAHLEPKPARMHLADHKRADHSPLTPEAVREIRRQVVETDKTYQELAAEFGCSFSTIGYIVRGERWLDGAEAVPVTFVCRDCGEPFTGHRRTRYCADCKAGVRRAA